MTKPELFDIIELLVDLPEQHQVMGTQGAIVACYDDENFEVEFTNDEGETTALCALSSNQFIVIWKSATKQWLPISDKVTAMLNRLSESKQTEVLKFTRSIYQH